ncbi:putative transmembrane protein [Gregarina niphandrodes]|uniref:Transmembrane protein n=1 Tax=Gregarina niphandrodes TaxID=110365 RepID=A0A023B9H2_GRENI|nr:putative transmembrane protein [Gregarina niphandrodes]EZG72979.1 putative transmembrane protein [Gregarina niphandrodes]|eukprot:XP_011129674.1 putative transmembrane protein [Gregarina niphandrodes]
MEQSNSRFAGSYYGAESSENGSSENGFRKGKLWDGGLWTAGYSYQRFLSERLQNGGSDDRSVEGGVHLRETKPVGRETKPVGLGYRLAQRAAADGRVENVSLVDLVRFSGLATRYVVYLVGSCILGAAAGFASPLAPVPLFRWDRYGGGNTPPLSTLVGLVGAAPVITTPVGVGVTSVGAVRTVSWELPMWELSERLLYTCGFLRVVGWLLVAPWADLFGRREVVVGTLAVSLLAACLLATLPGDCSMGVAVVVFQLSMPGWELNAGLLQSETAQPVSSVLPLSLIKFGSIAFGLGLWCLSWLRLWARYPDDARFADNYFAERMTFLICAGLLAIGFVFFRWVAHDSPQYLILKQNQGAAWAATQSLCHRDSVHHYLRSRLAHPPAQPSFAHGSAPAFAHTVTPVHTGAHPDAPLRQSCVMVLRTSGANAEYLDEPRLGRRVWRHLEVARDRRSCRLPPLLFVAILAAVKGVGYSLNSWAVAYWVGVLDRPHRNPRRLFTDFAALPGALLAYVMSDLWYKRRHAPDHASPRGHSGGLAQPVDNDRDAADHDREAADYDREAGGDEYDREFASFEQFRATLKLALGCCSAVLLLTLASPEVFGHCLVLRFVVACGLQTVSSALVICAGAMLIDGCSVNVRATYVAWARALGLAGYFFARLLHHSAFLALTPATWLFTYFLIFVALRKNGRSTRASTARPLPRTH